MAPLQPRNRVEAGNGDGEVHDQGQLGLGLHRQHDGRWRRVRGPWVDDRVRRRLRHHEHLGRRNRQPCGHPLRPAQRLLQRRRLVRRQRHLRVPGDPGRDRRHGGDRPVAERRRRRAAAGPAHPLGRRRVARRGQQRHQADGLHGQPLPGGHRTGDGQLRNRQRHRDGRPGLRGQVRHDHLRRRRDAEDRERHDQRRQGGGTQRKPGAEPLFTERRNPRRRRGGRSATPR